MTQITLPYRPVPGGTEDITEVMADLDAILAVVNGDLKDDNVANAAAIQNRKIVAPSPYLPGWGGRVFAPFVDGLDHMMIQSTGGGLDKDIASGLFVNWTDMAVSGKTLQWRFMGGFNLAALNGCTALAIASIVYSEVRGAGFGALWSVAGSHQITVSVGWKTFDSGWLAVPTAHLWGIYIPAYHIDYVTAAPTINYLNMGIEMRQV